MEIALVYIVFLGVIFITFYKPEISLSILLNINIFRAIPYVDYQNPRYGYYNENDVLLGATLPLLCFIIIIIKVLIKKKIKYKIDKLDVFMVLLSLIMLVSVLASPRKLISFNYTVVFLFLAAPFFFVTKLYFSNVKDKDKSLIIFITSIVFFATFFSIESLYLHSIAQYPYERMTFPGVYPIPFCLFLCLAIIIIIVYYIRPQIKTDFSKKAKRLFSLATMAIIAYAIIKTNTRGPVFAMILSFVLVLTIFFRIKFNLKIILASFFALIAGLTTLFTLFDVNEIATRFINLMPKNKEADSFASRIDTYIDSLRIFINKPFGISVGTFKEYLTGLNLNHRVDPYAHNLFLELISSFGVFGLLFSLLLIFLCLNEYNFIVKNQNKIFSKPHFFLIIVIMLFFFFETQFSFTLNTHKGWYLSMALYSVYKWDFIKQQQSNET